jgi:hypothetical protein
MDTTESDQHGTAEHRSTFPRTLLRVMIVQAVALALLWLLQARFGG